MPCCSKWASNGIAKIEVALFSSYGLVTDVTQKKPLPASPYQGRCEEIRLVSCPSPDKGRLGGVSRPCNEQTTDRCMAAVVSQLRLRRYPPSLTLPPQGVKGVRGVSSRSGFTRFFCLSGTELVMCFLLPPPLAGGGFGEGGGSERGKGGFLTA